MNFLLQQFKWYTEVLTYTYQYFTTEEYNFIFDCACVLLSILVIIIYVIIYVYGPNEEYMNQHIIDMQIKYYILMWNIIYPILRILNTIPRYRLNLYYYIIITTTIILYVLNLIKYVTTIELTSPADFWVLCSTSIIAVFLIHNISFIYKWFFFIFKNSYKLFLKLVSRNAFLSFYIPRHYYKIVFLLLLLILFMILLFLLFCYAYYVNPFFFTGQFNI